MVDISETRLARRDFLICCLLVCSALLTIASFTFAMYTVKEFSKIKARVSEIEGSLGNVHLLFLKDNPKMTEDSVKSAQVTKKARKHNERTASSGLPSPPKITNITILNLSRAINISWSHDSDGNIVVTNYILAFKSLHDEKWSDIYVSRTSRSFVLQNVENSETYFFKMFAMNDFGRGDPSAIHKTVPKEEAVERIHKKKMRKRAISIHLKAMRKVYSTKGVNTILWQETNKIGSIYYTNSIGHIVISVPGIYFIYSQLSIKGQESDIYTHEVYINDKKVLRRSRHHKGRQMMIGRGRFYKGWIPTFRDTSYHGAAFPLKKGDRVSVRSSGELETLDDGYFGVVQLSRIKHY